MEFNQWLKTQAIKWTHIRWKNSSIHSSNSIFQNFVFYLQTTIPVTALIDGEGHMTKTLNGPIQFGSIY